MEDHISKFEFLASDDSEEHFANCDFALKAGRHIQNHHHERKLYEYISANFNALSNFYLKLFGVFLRQGDYHDQLYYYLDFDQDSKGKFSGNRSDRLSARHTLFGLLLLKLQRIDHYFGKDEISVVNLKEQLKNDTNNYRDHIYRLFARVSGKGGASDVDESNIDTWIDNSLGKFEELGWIYFDETDKDQFTLLPSFNRLFNLYSHEIRNFENIQNDSGSNTSVV